MHDHRERHPYQLHAARLLDQAIASSGVKAEWLAMVLGIPATTLCMYRGGERPLPAYLVPLLDEALGGHTLLRGLTAMEGCEVQAPAADAGTPSSDLEPLIARHSGQLLAALIEARADGIITQAEREAIHPQIVRLVHELQAEADLLDPGTLRLRMGA